MNEAKELQQALNYEIQKAQGLKRWVTRLFKKKAGGKNISEAEAEQINNAFYTLIAAQKDTVTKAQAWAQIALE